MARKAPLRSEKDGCDPAMCQSPVLTTLSPAARESELLASTGWAGGFLCPCGRCWELDAGKRQGLQLVEHLRTLHPAVKATPTVSGGALSPRGAGSWSCRCLWPLLTVTSNLCDLRCKSSVLLEPRCY